MITLDYTVDPSKASDDFMEEGEEPAAKKRKSSESSEVRYFTLSVFPLYNDHRVSCTAKRCYQYLYSLQWSKFSYCWPTVNICVLITPCVFTLSPPIKLFYNTMEYHKGSSIGDQVFPTNKCLIHANRHLNILCKYELHSSVEPH